MVDVAASVEHDFTDPGFSSSFGHYFTDEAGSFNCRRFLNVLTNFLIQSGGRNNSRTFYVVNDLRIDMLTAAENRQSQFAVGSVFQSCSDAGFSFLK